MVWWVGFSLLGFGDSFLPCVTYIFIFSALEGHMGNGRQLGGIQVPRKSDSKKTVEGIIDFWF